MSELKTYSILNNVDLQEINIEKLHNEIKNSGFVEDFSGINTEEDNFTIVGESIVSENELDDLIYHHVVEGLDELKTRRYKEIDLRTGELISAGFTFDGHIFSMSLTAQINWSNFPNLPDQLFPLNVVDMSEEIYSLSLANKLNFYFSALNYKNQFLQNGGLLKGQIRVCETIEQVNVIIDNR